MTLVRFEPLRDLEHFSNRMSRLFNDFTNDFDFSPRIDISEDDKKIYIDIEAAGVKKDDINLTLQDNILTITGEKKKETQMRIKNIFVLKEYMAHSKKLYSSFRNKQGQCGCKI